MPKNFQQKKGKTHNAPQHKHKELRKFLQKLIIAYTLHLGNIYALGHSENAEMLSKLRSHHRSEVKMVLGTQEPVIKLCTATTAFASAGAGIIALVIGADMGGISGWSSWNAIFDEYQMLGCKFVLQHMFAISSNATPGVIGVVDYDDSTTLSSATAALGYDTRKVFGISSLENKQTKLKGQPQGQPDLAWVTTQTPVIPFWFKFINFGNLAAASTTYGYYYLEFTLKFRQVI